MFVSPERHPSYVKFDVFVCYVCYDVIEYDELYDDKQCYEKIR